MPAQVVGGDFYDFIDLGDHRQGIVIGDVAGRGIAAALYLARLISDFRAAAARASSPREALERLNQQLLTALHPRSVCHHDLSGAGGANG